MSDVKHVVIVAGEESGDFHAAELIKELKKRHPTIQISGVGGKHMQDAGAELVSDLAKYGITGLTEVIPFLGILYKTLKKIKQHLAEVKPDLLILVDSPGFNLRLAKYAKQKLHLPILYYISPQIWAWKAKRIHLIKKTIDTMAVILPFEKEIYDKAQVPAHFVGHPLTKKLAPFANLDRENARKYLDLPKDKHLIALLPGSRNNEVQQHMPVFIDTISLLAQKHPEWEYIIPVAETINMDSIEAYVSNTSIKVHLKKGNALECLIAADFVVVASGTASLEAALLNRPMCIIYKGSLLSYMVAMHFIKVKFLGLCNLLMNKMIVPEFLQYDCNPLELSRFIINFHNDPSQKEKMLSFLSALNGRLSSNNTDCSLIELVERELQQKHA